MPGMPDMQMLLQQVQQMQEEMAATEVTGQAGNGLVEITVNAPLQTSGLEIRGVRIDPKVVDADDVETLQDLVTGALQDAVAKGDKVAITGFGVFEKSERPARTARNPATGATIQVPESSVPKFRPGADFKALVNGEKK